MKKIYKDQPLPIYLGADASLQQKYGQQFVDKIDSMLLSMVKTETTEEKYRKALDKISKVMVWYKGPRVSQGTECVKIAQEALNSTLKQST